VPDFRDTELPIDLPALKAPPATNPEPPLLHDQGAGDRRWWLAGRRAHVEFEARRGLTGARFDTGPRLAGLEWASAAERVRIAPRAARFERGSGADRLLETVWIPERLAGVVVTVRPVEGWSPGVTVRGALHLQLPRGECGRAGDAGVRWLETGKREGLLAVAIGPEGPVDAFEAPTRTSDIATLPIVWTPEGTDAPLTLLLLSGHPAPASLRSLAVVLAHARRAGLAEQALRLASGDGEIDAAVAWGWTRIRDRIVDGVGALPALPATEAAPWVRAAIAVGLPDAARAILADDPGTVEEAAGWEAFAAGMGPGGPLDDLERRVGAGEGRPSDVRNALARVADRAGADRWAASLREAEAHTTRRLTLPSVGGASPAPQAAPDTSEPEPMEAGGVPTAATAAAWRSRASTPGGALDPEGWRIVAELVDGVLGWSPDAASGRMHLTPTLPEGWTRFSLSGLRGGELRMRLEWTRSEGGETWRFAPMAGAVPATLILRLPVPDEVTPVEVDGVPADLDPERVGDGVRVPIQIQLDRERVVRVGSAAGSGGDPAEVSSPSG